MEARETTTTTQHAESPAGETESGDVAHAWDPPSPVLAGPSDGLTQLSNLLSHFRDKAELWAVDDLARKDPLLVIQYLSASHTGFNLHELRDGVRLARAMVRFRAQVIVKLRVRTWTITVAVSVLLATIVGFDAPKVWVAIAAFLAPLVVQLAREGRDIGLDNEKRLLDNWSRLVTELEKHRTQREIEADHHEDQS